VTYAGLFSGRKRDATEQLKRTDKGDNNVKIGVTGATGQLGRLVVRELLQTQAAGDIVAIARSADKAADLAAQGVEVRVAAYDDRAALLTALGGVDKLVFISGSEVGRRIEQHRNVIDAAKAAGVQHVIYTSAPKATTTSLILAPDHKATEEYLAASGLNYTILRMNWYTENYLQQVRTAQQTGSIVAAVGEGRVASATRPDLAAGIVAVLTGAGHEGQIYEFGGDQAWTFHELAAAISEVLGQPVTYQPVDGATLIEILTGVGLDEGTAGFVAALDANIAAGALAETTGDLSRLIGRPTTGLVEGLRSGSRSESGGA
jgi:NAD(P)H dehydrogenase (quinone)